MKITLKTLPQATAQQVFDQVARHLLTQGRKSVATEHGGSICVYRSPDGLKCAAGCLIADGEYSPKMEGIGWGGLIAEYAVPKQHANLVCALQHVHDRSMPGAWPSGLYEVACEFGLHTAVLDEFEEFEP